MRKDLNSGAVKWRQIGTGTLSTRKDVIMITDEDVLDMFHRLTEEEQIAIFSRMILVEKSRLCVESLINRP